MRAISRSFASGDAPNEGIAVFAALALYAQSLYNNGPPLKSWFTQRASSTLPALAHDQCFPSLYFSIASSFRTAADLYQSEFISNASACNFAAPCAQFEPWSSRLIAEQPGNFTSSAPALILQGGADTLVTPSSVACIAKRLKAKGTPVMGCLYPYDSHTTIVASALPQMLRWVDERRSGGSTDVCPAALPDSCPP